MTTPTLQLADSQHPWIGLASFTEGEREFFAGRGEEIDELLRLVRRDILTVLYGVSGLGKTSLLRAGLFPALRAEDCLPVPIRLDYLKGAAPLGAQVSRAIIVAADAAGVEAPQPRPDETLWEYLHREGNHFWSSHNDLVTPFLAIDQFEELFTVGRETPERAARTTAFISELADLVENRPPVALRDDPLRAKEFSFKPAPLKVLLAMREDYLAELYRIRFHFRALGQNRLRLLPMGERQARQVIALGAPLLAPGVEDRILKFVAGSDDDDDAEITVAPALLSLVLRELNERRLARGVDAKITPDLLDVEQHKIFEDFYLRTIEDFPVGVRTFIEDKLLTTTGYRDSCALDDALSRPDVTQPILNELVNRRLLAYEDGHRTRRVELMHDVLIPVIKASRDTRLMRETLAQAELRERLAQEEKERQERELEVARRLAEAQRGRAEEAEKREQEEKVSGELRERLAREARERQERELEAAQKLARTEAERADDQARTAARLRWLMVTMVVFFCAAVIAAIFAFNSAAEARRDAQQTLSRQLAAQSLADADTLPQRSLLVAAEAVRLARDAGIFQYEYAARLLHTLLGATGGVPLVGHMSAVNAVAFSSDGRAVATGSADGTARIWNAAHPQAAPLVLSGHTAPVTSLAFSGDGRWLATASADGTARLWDAKHPETAPVVLAGHQGAINALAISADSRWLATASEDHTTRLWDLKTAHPSVSPVVLGGHTERVTCVAFSGTGRWLATASHDDSTIWLWDMTDPAHAGHRITHEVPVSYNEDAINAIAFSPDERRLAVTFGSVVQLWDLTAADPPAKPLLHGRHAQSILAVGFSPDGHWLATAGIDAAVKLWDLTAADPAAHPVVLYGHRAAINALAFSSTGRWLATAGQDATVRLWDLTDLTIPSVVLRGHESAINAIAFSPDGLRLATASNDTQARLWDIPDASPDRVVMRGHSAIVRAVSFSPNGQRLVTGSDDGTARVWNVTNPQADPLVLPGGGPVTTVSFSADGHWLATGIEDSPSLRLWKLTTSDPAIVPIILWQTANLRNLAFSPDGHWLVTTGSDGNLRMWKMDNGTPSPDPSIYCHLQEQVRGLAFSADGLEMATGSNGYTARLWRLADKNPFSAPLVIRAGPVVSDLALSRDSGWLATTSWEPDFKAKLWRLAGAMPPHLSAVLQFKNRVGSVAFSPDAHWLAAAANDQAIQLLDMTDLTKAPISLIGHQGRMFVVAFSPDGQWLASMSEDHTICLWNPARPTAEAVILHDGSGFFTMSFSPDGRWLATGSGDGTVRLWYLQVDELVRLARRTAGRNLTKEEWKTFFRH